MAEERKQEYNPVVLGFSNAKGPLDIPLNQARKKYGKLPSSYGFVPPKAGRENKKGLNLDLGKFVREALKDKGHSFKADVFGFFRDWHRNYLQEFGFDPAPFLNMNDPLVLAGVIRDNQSVFQPLLALDLRQRLVETGVMRKEIVNSIPDAALHKTAYRILEKKKEKMGHGAKRGKVVAMLDQILALETLCRIETMTGSSLGSPDPDALKIYADEIAGMLLGLPREIVLKRGHDLKGLRGQGIEFEFAPRDASYLMLGKTTGDCTADKRNFQADRNIENIFWTIFSWILDQNYQILKVHYNGDFIMKIHLLPLYISDTGLSSNVPSNLKPQNSEFTILAVDAVETIRGFRDDLPAFAKPHLLENKNAIFDRAVEKIIGIASKMGIHEVYAEKFSNTGWVRNHLEGFSEVFFHVDHIQKIDQLEDVFYLARALCEAGGKKPPGELFMEIQMKNIYLSPKHMSRAPGVKSFAVIKGDPGLGIPMNKVVGV